MTMGNAGPPSSTEPPAAPQDEPARADGVPPLAENEGVSPDRGAEVDPESAAVAAQELEAAPADSDEAVRAALERVLGSPDLCTSPRLGAFLRYVVGRTLEGRADQIKGYTIAVEALGRPPSFDPQADPIVRVEATRLRRALQNYYNTVGLADPVLIHIPKGGYVPQFQVRTVRAAATAPAPPAVLPEPERRAGDAASQELGSPPPVVSRPRFGRLRWAAAAAVAGVLLAGVAARLIEDVELPGPFQGLGGERPSMADRVRLPIVEVGMFETADGRGPARGDLRSIEERLRDSFALFDFVEVRDGAGDAAALARECNGRRPRSVFSVGGYAEAREDGLYTLLVHLTDRCQGLIVWSHAIEGLKPAALGDEQRVVREVAATLLEGYGVVPVRARSQALAHAPGSGFACIAETFSVLRNDGTAAATTPRSCLATLVDRDGEFALGHAVRAAALLDEAMRGTQLPLAPDQAQEMLREAELAADLAPTSAYAARTLALVQRFLGESEAAVASAERARQLNPLDHDIAATVGTVLIGAGRVEEGEVLLLSARAAGAPRAPLQDAYLAIAAFLRGDPFAAQALVPQLKLHPSPGNKLALALALHALNRDVDEREAVRILAHLDGGGPEAVRRLVHRLLPAPGASARALDALENAGLSQEAANGKRPHG